MSKVKTNWVRKLVFSITFIYLMLTKYILLQYLAKMRFVFSYSFFPRLANNQYRVILMTLHSKFIISFCQQNYILLFFYIVLWVILFLRLLKYLSNILLSFFFFLFAYLPSVLSQRCKVHRNTIKFWLGQSIAFDSASVRFWRSPHYWHVFHLYDSFIYVFILIEFLTLP